MTGETLRKFFLWLSWHHTLLVLIPLSGWSFSVIFKGPHPLSNITVSALFISSFNTLAQSFLMCPLRILWIYIYIIFPFLYLAPAFFLRSRQISNCPRLYQMDYPTISSASAQNQAQTYNFLHEPLLVLPMFSFPEAREPGNFQGPVYSTWKFLLFSFSSFKQ